MSAERLLKSNLAFQAYWCLTVWICSVNFFPSLFVVVSEENKRKKEFVFLLDRAGRCEKDFLQCRKDCVIAPVLSHVNLRTVLLPCKDQLCSFLLWMNQTCWLAAPVCLRFSPTESFFGFLHNNFKKQTPQLEEKKQLVLYFNFTASYFCKEQLQPNFDQKTAFFHSSTCNPACIFHYRSILCQKTPSLLVIK